MRVPRLAFALALAMLAAGCASSPPDTGTPSTKPTFQCAKPAAEEIVVNTTQGCFTILLLPDAAPKTVAHIQQLANASFYDGIPFHRYEADFVIQGGDPNCKTKGVDDPSCGSGGSGTNVPNEVSPTAKHDFGAVGLADAGPGTGDSQFYVVIGKDGAHFLDGRYCVFGKVTTGMDVVTKLRKGDVMVHVTAG